MFAFSCSIESERTVAAFSTSKWKDNGSTRKSRRQLRSMHSPNIQYVRSKEKLTPCAGVSVRIDDCLKFSFVPDIRNEAHYSFSLQQF